MEMMSGGGAVKVGGVELIRIRAEEIQVTPALLFQGEK